MLKYTMPEAENTHNFLKFSIEGPHPTLSSIVMLLLISKQN